MEQFEIHRKIKQKVQKAAACAPFPRVRAPFPRVRSHLRGRRPSPRGTLVAGGGPDRHIVTTPFTVLFRALCRRRAVCGFWQVSGDTYPSLQRHSDEPRGPHALWVPPVRPSLPHSGHPGSCSRLSAPAFSMTSCGWIRSGLCRPTSVTRWFALSIHVSS